MIVAVPPSGPRGVGLGHGPVGIATAGAGSGELPRVLREPCPGAPAVPHAVVTTLRPTTIAIAARMRHAPPIILGRRRPRSGSVRGRLRADRAHVVRPEPRPRPVRGTTAGVARCEVATGDPRGAR